MREIIRAEYSGFCFGVDRAVKEAFTVRKFKGRTFTLGPLIHNKDVTERLEKSGVSEISEGEIGKLDKDDTVIIRTHGYQGGL